MLSNLRMQQSELKDLKAMFLKVDSSQDGFLSLDELRAGLSEVLGSIKADSPDWYEVIDQLDTNNDGKIDYSEFITAAVDRAKLLNQQNLEIGFQMFDQDGNGKISRDELKNVFHSANQEDTLLWEAIIEEVDKDHDNFISHQEFFEAMNAVVTQRSSNLI